MTGPAIVGGLSLDQNFSLNKLNFSPPTAPIFTLQSRLWLEKSWISISSTLIDSGASSCFIDRRFVNRHNIPTRKKCSPISVEVIDGRKLESGHIVQETLTMRLRIGKHEEQIAFNIIKSPKYPIILGMSWLVKHNPRVDWLTRTMSFDCQCMHEQQPEEAQEPPPTPRWSKGHTLLQHLFL